MSLGPSIARTVQTARYLIVNRVRTARYVLAAWIKPRTWLPGDPGTLYKGRQALKPDKAFDRRGPTMDQWFEGRHRTPPSPCTDPPDFVAKGDRWVIK